MKRIYHILSGIIIVIFMLYITFGYIFKSFQEVYSIKYLLVISLFIVFIYVIYRLYKKIKLRNIDMEYIRDYPKHYSIPVVAFLHKKNIKVKPLIMATILKLYDYDLINISKQDNKIICSSKNFNNIHKLSKSEKYILDWLIDNDKRKYSYKTLTLVITDELYENGLVKENSKRIMTSLIAIGVCGIFAGLQIFGLIPIEFYEYTIYLAVSALLFFVFIYRIKPVINLDYSKEGKKEHYNTLRFYNFLDDFTRLSQRQMEEYVLWKEYLQYAVLFGINKNYDLKEKLNILTLDEFLDYLEELGERN